MKDIRISRLILNLNQKELDIVEKQFSKNKQKLFSTILEAILQLKKKELTRDEIYLRIYKKNFSQKNDAPFRNHLSDLADLIEDILIENKLQEKYKTNEQFELQQKLDLYFDLNLEKDFEATLKKAKEYALQNFEYGFYTKELERYIVLFRKNMNSAKEGLEKMMMIDNDYQIFYELQQDLDNGKAQYNKGFSVLYYYHCGHVNKLTPTNLQPYETMVENCTTDIGKYWSLYGLCFLVYDHIEGYMHHFESFLNIARKIDSTNPTFNVHLISALQMIATKHVHLGFFEKANQFYEEIFEILKKQEVKNVSPSVYINYIMNLVKLNRYKDAIIQISYVEKNIQLNQQDKTQLTIRKIMCYTFLEDAENLINAIYSIEYANLVATHRIYFRLSLCNAYLIQQNFLLAETEINNLLRSKLMKEVDADFLPCAELMNYLIVQIRKNNKLAISNEQTEIFNTLQITLKVNQYPYLKNYTPYLWLTEKLGL